MELAGIGRASALLRGLKAAVMFQLPAVERENERERERKGKRKRVGGRALHEMRVTSTQFLLNSTR